jgi:hypothetical protein
VKRSLLVLRTLYQFLDPIEQTLIGESGRQTLVMRERGYLEPDDRLNVVKKVRIPGCVVRSIPRKTHMDTTTLLVIVLLILLLGGGGWYGRGRWY